MRPSCSSVSPGPSNSTSVDSGLGKRVVAGGKFCGSYSSSFIGCPVSGPRLLADVFPVDGKDDDELRAGDEEESAEVPKSLPNPYQPTRSETTVLRISLLGLGVDTAWKAGVASLVMAETLSLIHI